MLSPRPRSHLCQPFSAHMTQTTEHVIMQLHAGNPTIYLLGQSSRVVRSASDFSSSKKGLVVGIPNFIPCHCIARKSHCTLNKFCRRETFVSEIPFTLARRVPNNTWKALNDAWNGYHSVPPRESDRHLTTFITPFGRWRYTRAPQGYLSLGDGYKRRFAANLYDFMRKKQCLDDTVFFDESLEQWFPTYFGLCPT